MHEHWLLYSWCLGVSPENNSPRSHRVHGDITESRTGGRERASLRVFVVDLFIPTQAPRHPAWHLEGEIFFCLPGVFIGMEATPLEALCCRPGTTSTRPSSTSPSAC